MGSIFVVCQHHKKVERFYSSRIKLKAIMLIVVQTMILSGEGELSWDFLVVLLLRTHHHSIPGVVEGKWSTNKENRCRKKVKTKFSPDL